MNNDSIDNAIKSIKDQVIKICEEYKFDFNRDFTTQFNEDLKSYFGECGLNNHLSFSIDKTKFTPDGLIQINFNALDSVGEQIISKLKQQREEMK